MKPVIAVIGPTAAGKTRIAVEVAEKLGGEVISVDSALIYRGMDIGTAKPDDEEMRGIPHHLIDIRDPWETYSAAEFFRDAEAAAGDIISRGHVPILAGGTMMYMRSLAEGLSPLPESNPEVRAGLTSFIEEHGLKALHDKLAEVDPASAARINENDPQRTIRALEIWEISGRTMTELLRKPGRAFRYPLLTFMTLPERSYLREKIRLRFVAMLKNGFEDEVRGLMATGKLRPDMPSMRSVGYRQMWQYLSGELSREEMIFRAVTATCQLAKHQTTWCRGWKKEKTEIDPRESGASDMIASAWRAAPE